MRTDFNMMKRIIYYIGFSFIAINCSAETATTQKPNMQALALSFIMEMLKAQRDSICFTQNSEFGYSAIVNKNKCLREIRSQIEFAKEFKELSNYEYDLRNFMISNLSL